MSDDRERRDRTMSYGLLRASLLNEIDAERERQIRKWGLQPLPMALPSDRYSALEEIAKANCDMAMEQGNNSHALVIAEEAAEVYAAAQAFNASERKGPKIRDKLRTELIQLAACCVKALEQLEQEVDQ